MNLTRKQITIVVASLLDYQNEYRLDSEMYKDIAEIVNILGYYKGELQSAQDYEIPTHGLDKLIGKLNKQLEEHK